VAAKPLLAACAEGATISASNMATHNAADSIAEIAVLQISLAFFINNKAPFQKRGASNEPALFRTNPVFEKLTTRSDQLL
jgi:hypothetical protein